MSASNNSFRSLFVFVTGLLVFCIIAGAETQKEKDLKEQLAAAQNTQQAQIKLSNSLVSLTAKNKTDYTRTAELAAKNAEAAKEAADTAAQKAVAAADRIEAKIEILQKISQQGTSNVLITEVSGFMVVLVGLVFKAYTDYRDHSWAKAAAMRTESLVSAHKVELEEVKTEARQAYVSANGFAEKLQSVNDKLNSR